jgi:hypothetical protein
VVLAWLLRPAQHLCIPATHLHPLAAVPPPRTVFVWWRGKRSVCWWLAGGCTPCTGRLQVRGACVVAAACTARVHPCHPLAAVPHGCRRSGCRHPQKRSIKLSSALTEFCGGLCGWPLRCLALCMTGMASHWHLAGRSCAAATHPHHHDPSLAASLFTLLALWPFRLPMQRFLCAPLGRVRGSLSPSVARSPLPPCCRGGWGGVGGIGEGLLLPLVSDALPARRRRPLLICPSCCTRRGRLYILPFSSYNLQVLSLNFSLSLSLTAS